MTIIIYNKNTEPQHCTVGRCKQPAFHSLITLGDEVVLCERHLKQWAQEVLKIVDEVVQK